jgi:hypothetical protein
MMLHPVFFPPNKVSWQGSYQSALISENYQ